jgi:hypothetical protein
VAIKDVLTQKFSIGKQRQKRYLWFQDSDASWRHCGWDAEENMVVFDLADLIECSKDEHAPCEKLRQRIGYVVIPLLRFSTSSSLIICRNDLSCLARKIYNSIEEAALLSMTSEVDEWISSPSTV